MRTRRSPASTSIGGPGRAPLRSYCRRPSVGQSRERHRDPQRASVYRGVGLAAGYAPPACDLHASLWRMKSRGLQIAIEFFGKAGEPVDAEPDLDPILIDVHPLDQELDNPGLLGREEFVPER